MQYPRDQPLHKFHADNLDQALGMVELIKADLELRKAWHSPVTVTAEDHDDLVMAKSLLKHIGRQLGL